MKKYKHHKSAVFHNVLLLLSVIAAITVGGRLWKSAQVAIVPSASAHERWQANYGKLPLSFEPNRGQAAKPVEFLARGDGYNLSLLANEAVLKLDKPASDTKAKAATATLRIKLVGANQKPHVSGVESLQGKTNYLIGPDPKKWQTDIPTYAKVKYENVYPGVDAIFYGNQRQLEYDFIVAPGADPQAIRLDFAGAKSVRLDGNGELILATAAGDVRQHRPVVYQQINGTRRTIAGNYKLKGHQATFKLGDYDSSHPLVIDPVVSYATLFGEGVFKDDVRAMTVDALGNAYLTGQTRTATFPVTSSLTPPGGLIPEDAVMMFVTKLNGAGNGVIYSTVIGGTKGYKSSPTSREIVLSVGGGIAVDAQGNASIGGNTTSYDFPTTSGAYRTAGSSASVGAGDAVVLKLNAAGSGLLASTLFGSTGQEAVWGLALDAAGNFCITGNTTSTDLPNSDSATGKVGTNEAVFAARISANASMLIHSNVLDSAGFDYGRAIATDQQGNIYIAGTTYDGYVAGSTTLGARFPRTQGAFDFNFSPAQRPEWGTPYGAYVAKFGPTGRLVFSSVLGDGNPKAIAIDREGNVCITGVSQFVRTIGTYGQPDFQAFDVFPRTDSTMVLQENSIFGPQTSGLMLLKLNPAGTEVLLSHRFGYPTDEDARGITVDAQGYIHITGYTMFGFIGPDGPIELEPLHNEFNYHVGRSHAYHLKFTPDGKTVDDVNFFRSAEGYGVSTDPAGNIYILGVAGAGFRTTPGAFQTEMPETPQPQVFFVAKLGNALNPGATPTPTPTPTPGPSFTLSGRVTTAAGQAVGGVTVSLHGAIERHLITGGDGRYSFAGVPQSGSYTLDAVSVSGKRLHPEQYVFQTLNANQTADFVIRPTAQALTNLSAASYAGNLAADSIVTAFGVNLATATQVAMSSPLPTQLSGTSVKVRDALGVERLAPLFFVSPTQINYLTPPGTAAGLAIVTVTSGNGAISGAMAEVEPVAPGLFTADASGRGLASAVVFRVKANGEQSYEPVAVFDNSQSKMVPVPVDPGPQGDQVFLLLFGTGFRNNSGISHVTAQLGGVSAQASFAGAQGGFAGLDQANVLLPRSLAGRGEVNLVLSVDGKAANTVKLWVK